MLGFMASALKQLEQAYRHVIDGRRIIAAQRLRIERMKRNGLQTANAEALLQTFERSQALFEDDLAALYKHGTKRLFGLS